MPVFFFHLRSAAGIEPDEEGVECADIESAYLEAVRAIPGMAADLISEGSNPMDHAFEITDRHGVLLLDVPFTETLRPPARKTPRHIQRMDAKTLLERAQHLSVEVQEQVETLRTSIGRTWDLVDDTHRFNRRFP